MKFVCVDGNIRSAEEALLFVSNRSFRYGDGLFETMKMINGRIILKKFHFERLFGSLQVLKYKIPSLFIEPVLESKIKELAEKNECSSLCRIRLTVFRGNGNLYPTGELLNYLIECADLDASVNELNEHGLSIGLYKEAHKTCDPLSAVKSANFLPYIMAAMYAEENKLDDCLLLNAKGAIADTTMANIFLIKGNNIYTPALSQGCVNGVMRRYLLDSFEKKGYACVEAELQEEDLLEADEVFLTNAIRGIRWVEKYTTREYKSSHAGKIYNDFIKTIFS